jgi:hypothetical protein
MKIGNSRPEIPFLETGEIRNPKLKSAPIPK